MKIGYARVSTKHQSLEAQIERLKEYGCEKIFSDSFTGSVFNRKGFDDMCAHLRKGDELVVTRLDRIGRMRGPLIDFIDDLHKRGIMLTLLDQNIDTTTVMGRTFLQINAIYAEAERALGRERILNAQEMYRKRGLNGGRKRKLNTVKETMLKQMYESKEYSIAKLCEEFEITPPTLYRILQRLDKPVTAEKKTV